MEKRIIHIDASILRHSTCDRCFYLKLLKGYRNKLNPACIEFGQAFHGFVKMQSINPDNTRVNIQNAMKYLRETPSIPDKRIKYFTEAYLAKICSEWLVWNEESSWDLLKDTNGRPVVEFKFRIKIYEDDYCIINLNGTMDKLLVHRTSKLLSIGDYKTTSAWESDTYLSQYNLSGQLAIYTKALKHHINISTPDSVLFPYKDKTTAAFIEGIFLSAAGVEFKTSDVRFDHQMNLPQLDIMLARHCENISRMAQMEKSNAEVSLSFMPAPQGMLNGACKYCDFFTCCSCDDERAFNAGLERGFIQREYNPLNFAGEKEGVCN